LNHSKGKGEDKECEYLHGGRGAGGGDGGDGEEDKGRKSFGGWKKRVAEARPLLLRRCGQTQVAKLLMDHAGQPASRRRGTAARLLAAFAPVHDACPSPEADGERQHMLYIPRTQRSDVALLSGP
jgi:hypothetical protein